MRQLTRKEIKDLGAIVPGYPMMNGEGLLTEDCEYLPAKRFSFIKYADVLVEKDQSVGYDYYLKAYRCKFYKSNAVVGSKGRISVTPYIRMMGLQLNDTLYYSQMGSMYATYISGYDIEHEKRIQTIWKPGTRVAIEIREDCGLGKYQLHLIKTGPYFN